MRHTFSAPKIVSLCVCRLVLLVHHLRPVSHGAVLHIFQCGVVHQLPHGEEYYSSGRIHLYGLHHHLLHRQVRHHQRLCQLPRWQVSNAEWADVLRELRRGDIVSSGVLIQLLPRLSSGHLLPGRHSMPELPLWEIQDRHGRNKRDGVHRLPRGLDNSRRPEKLNRCHDVCV